MVTHRELYYRYVMIRDCVNYKKCKKLPLKEVKERVNKQMDFVSNLCNLTEEEIIFAIDYCEKHFPAII